MKRNEFLSNCMSGYTEDAAEDAYALFSGIYYAPDLISECETLIASLDNVRNGERTVDVFRETLRILSSEIWNRIRKTDDEDLRKRSMVLRANDTGDNADILMRIFAVSAEMVDADKDGLAELADQRLKLIWEFCDAYTAE